MLWMTHVALGFDADFLVVLIAGVVGSVLHALAIKGWRSMLTRQAWPETIVGGAAGALYPRILQNVPFFTTVYAWDTAEKAIFVFVLSFCTSFFLLSVVTKLAQRKSAEIVGEPDLLIELRKALTLDEKATAEDVLA